MKKILTHPFILSLLIIAGLVLVNNQGWLNPVKNLFYSLVSPGQGLSYRVSFRLHKFFNFVTSINRLEEEKNKLEEENQEFLGQLARFQEVVRENELLRRQIGIAGLKSANLILANIIGRDAADLREYFLIGKGIKDGIEKGDIVIAAGNLLVGQVTEVADSLAKIQLIIDSSSRINALIQESEMAGLVRIERRDLVIDLLPQGETIESGQLVVTSGLAGFFPAGLLVGQIEKVISSDVQTSQMAKLKPAVDFEKLRKIFVIID